LNKIYNNNAERQQQQCWVTETTLRRIGNVLGQNIEQQSAAIEVFVSFLFFFYYFRYFGVFSTLAVVDSNECSMRTEDVGGLDYIEELRGKSIVVSQPRKSEKKRAESVV